LARAGYEIHLVAPGVGNFKADGVHINGVNKPRRSRLGRFTKIAWQIYQTARLLDADIYHFHDPELLPYGILLRAQGKKVIYDAHEDLKKIALSKEYIPEFTRSLVASSLGRFERFAARQFSAVVAATPGIEENFKHLNKKTVNVNNFPLLSEFTGNVEPWVKKEKAICYVGGIAKVRGIVETVRAIGHTPYRLLLAGSRAQNGFRSSLVEEPGWQQVDELGYLDRKGVASVLNRSMVGTVLLHPIPNYLESWPIKLFEYWAAGIPVVASDFPLWRRLIEENDAGFCVNPFDSRAVAEKLTWLVEHPDEAHRMGENGRRLVTQKYNWDECEKPLLKLYSELDH